MPIKNPLVSIIVPTYNVKHYIRECIESILNQTYKNIEIIIVNDGSTDNSMYMIDDYVTSIDKIKVINQENQGLSAARNSGIEKAKGKYVAMIDSDDKIKPDFIKNLVKTAMQTNADIVRGSFRDFHGNIPTGWIADFVTDPNTGEIVLNEFLDHSTSFVVWSSLYSREFLNTNNLRFTPGILLEDGDFTCRAYLAAHTVITTDYTDYMYRIRPGSILTSNNAKRMSESEDLIVDKFLNMIESTQTLKTKQVITKAVYAFMRDWTRILSKNKIKFDRHTSSFNTALKSIKPIVKQQSSKEQLKFNTKVFIIKIKNP